MKNLINLIALMALLASVGCASLTPEEIAAINSRKAAIEQKARNGEILTLGQWQDILRPTDGWTNKTTDWLFGLIGRPDETMKDPTTSASSVFLFFEGKIIDDFTGKPDTLCVSTIGGLVGSRVYDATLVKKL